MQIIKLSIFDDGERIGVITSINGKIFIFGRSAREWRDLRRLVDSGGYEVNSNDSKFLDHVASRAHSYNYSTELV